MIKDKVFSAKITKYKNYLGGCENRAEPVEVVHRIGLLSLLERYYGNSGAFIYAVNKYELYRR